PRAAVRNPKEPSYLERRIAEEAGPVISYRLVAAHGHSDWPASKDELQRLVDEGLTNVEIGQRFDVSRQAVATRLSELGIRRSPDIQSEIRRRKALEREGRRRGAPAVEPAPA